MANILSVSGLSKSFGDKDLFDDLSFGLAEGQKSALIGVNGSGKSTLLRILAGVETADTGKAIWRKGLRIAYLPQEPVFDPQLTIGQLIYSEDNEALQLIRRYEELVADHKGKDDELARVMAEIDAADAWQYEQKIREILSRLEVDLPQKKIGELSGGQVKRVALAHALIDNPDMLILDEPTNHLDIGSIEFLEKFLSTARTSLLLVTHDRYFLDSVVNHILELDQGGVWSYEGKYNDYLEKKQLRLEQEAREQARLKNLYSRELDWLRRSPKARTSKSRARITAAEELGEAAGQRRDDSTLNLQVKGRRIGGQVLELKNLRKAYGDLTILDNFSYTFKRRDRIGIVGPNGVGKTTFVRIMLGQEGVDSGKVRLGETIVPGYYSQSGMKFKDNQRVIEVVREAAETVELSKSQTLSADQLLEHFLFPRHMHSQMVDTLSGGEKRRLHLLRVLMTNPNLLILDEPTNDLDLETMRRLEEFLLDFEGSLVVVTHDRFFMDQLVDHLFVFEGDGQVRDFPGNYTQYRQWLDEQEPKPPSDPPQTPESTGSEKPKNRARKLSFNEKREFEALETEIEQLETRKEALTTALSSGETDYEKVTAWARELEEIKSELEEKELRWLELAEVEG